MNEVMAACLGIVDAISAGQDPEVAKKKRARTVREVERYVKKLGKAGHPVLSLAQQPIDARPHEMEQLSHAQARPKIRQGVFLGSRARGARGSAAYGRQCLLRGGLRGGVHQHAEAGLGRRRLGQIRGSMSHASCPDPGAYERANDMLLLQSWRPL
jgi:hypothetical protein